MTLQRDGDDASAVVAAGDVGGQPADRAWAARELSDASVEVVLIAPGHQDVDAGRGQPVGDPPTDAPAAARHDCRAAGERGEHVTVLPMVEIRLGRTSGTRTLARSAGETRQPQGHVTRTTQRLPFAAGGYGRLRPVDNGSDPTSS